jgi:hypothetical protein
MEREEERRLYNHLKCPVCGVPWYSYDALRWPLHSPKCAGHSMKPAVPSPVAPEKVALANLPRELRPKLNTNGELVHDAIQTV